MQILIFHFSSRRINNFIYDNSLATLIRRIQLNIVILQSQLNIVVFFTMLIKFDLSKQSISEHSKITKPLVELFNENVERASGKGWVDREMEGNRISGEFPTRLIDSLASASDMPVISV